MLVKSSQGREQPPQRPGRGQARGGHSRDEGNQLAAAECGAGGALVLSRLWVCVGASLRQGLSSLAPLTFGAGPFSVPPHQAPVGRLAASLTPAQSTPSLTTTTPDVCRQCCLIWGAESLPSWEPLLYGQTGQGRGRPGVQRPGSDLRSLSLRPASPLLRGFLGSVGAPRRRRTQPCGPHRPCSCGRQHSPMALCLPAQPGALGTRDTWAW